MPLDFYVVAFVLNCVPPKCWWYPFLGANYCSNATNTILYEFDIMHAVSLRCTGTKLTSLYFHYHTIKCISVPPELFMC